jgi:hypothetical protein
VSRGYLSPSIVDAAVALLCFLGLPSGAWIYLILREVKRLREEREGLRLDAEAMAAEGYPPPGPPTTDSQPGFVPD